MVAKLSLITRIKTWLLFACIRYHQKRIDKVFAQYKADRTKEAYLANDAIDAKVDLESFYKVSKCNVDVDVLNSKTKKEN